MKGASNSQKAHPKAKLIQTPQFHKLGMQLGSDGLVLG